MKNFVKKLFRINNINKIKKFKYKIKKFKNKIKKFKN